MKFHLLTIIVFLCFLPSDVFAQKKSEFTEALILTKAGDTLLCFVSVQVEYKDRIEYRRHLDAESEVLAAENISIVVTGTRLLESVFVGDHEELMTLVVSGRANLYNSVSITEATYSPHQGGYSSQSTSVSYVIKKNRIYHSVKRLSFKADVSKLFNDCPPVVRKVATKEYNFMDMEAIVREYNQCGYK